MEENKCEDEDVHDTVVDFDITNQMIEKLFEAFVELYQNGRFEWEKYNLIFNKCCELEDTGKVKDMIKVEKMKDLQN